MVTSRAVVGSSATMTSGSLAMAMAIMARWRMPPENSCGNAAARRAGFGDADQVEEFDGAFRWPLPAVPRWARIASAIWSPIR